MFGEHKPKSFIEKVIQLCGDSVQNGLSKYISPTADGKDKSVCLSDSLSHCTDAKIEDNGYSLCCSSPFNS